MLVVCATAFVAATHHAAAGNLQSTEGSDKALSVVTTPPQDSRSLLDYLASMQP